MEGNGQVDSEAEWTRKIVICLYENFEGGRGKDMLQQITKLLFSIIIDIVTNFRKKRFRKKITSLSIKETVRRYSRGHG